MATFRLTAGRFQSLPSVIIAEGLVQQGHDLAAIHVASPWRPSRLRRLVRQRGLRQVLKRWLQHERRENTSKDLEMLAREYDVASGSLRRWARRRGVPILVTGDLNDRRVIDTLTTEGQDAVIYSGGGILRGEFIKAAGRTLNAHAGPLPEIRGMNAAEWALMLDQPPEVTVHLIDRGIDTGPILMRKLYDRTALPSIAALRERAVATGVRALLEVARSGEWAEGGEPTAGAVSRQCFVMAPAIRDLALRRLRR